MLKRITKPTVCFTDNDHAGSSSHSCEDDKRFIQHEDMQVILVRNALIDTTVYIVCWGPFNTV